MEQIGRFIAECRKEKGLTQEQLAEKLGVSNRSVSRWENGKTMPDYSLYESICKELGITICELFAAQHANPQNQVAIANYSLDQILRENARMKKQKKGLSIALLVLVIVLVIPYILQGLIIYGVLLFDVVAPTKTKRGVESYDKSFYLEEYGGDLGSTLMIFPDDLEGRDVLNFKSGLKTGFFDTDGYILLECSMSDRDFQQEIERLSSLKATIQYEEETFTNYILYDEESYPYPAYIACDGFDSTYEYALIDKDSNRIIYLYISYPSVTNLNYAKYLKKNPLEYIHSSLDDFSLYYHTFDGGQSYIFIQD